MLYTEGFSTLARNDYVMETNLSDNAFNKTNQNEMWIQLDLFAVVFLQHQTIKLRF